MLFGLHCPQIWLQLFILVFLISSAVTQNFIATYGPAPAPFTIDVSAGFIEDTRVKASLTRYTEDIDQPDLADGPPRHSVAAVRDYWANHYQWASVQDRLNRRYNQFTTTVTAPGFNYSDSVPLHFVHHRSNRTDAIPLLFIHGWPGSFMEVDHILDGLLHPSNNSLPAFHVVAPSIPGFGFSPAPKSPGLGSREAGSAFNELMHQLGYPQYVIQGGDFGGIILRYMAGNYPTSVLSILSNFWVVPPNATDRERYDQNLTTPDETAVIKASDRGNDFSAGYRLIQETRPLQLAIAMTDSPVGFAMWIYDLMVRIVENYVWTLEELITWAMMYYIQGPYGGMRLYKESLLRVGAFRGLRLDLDYPFVHQPVAISQFFFDTYGYRVPLDWARRYGNVVARNVHDHGGHFAAVETPDILLDDIRSFWGNASLSNLDALAAS